MPVKTRPVPDTVINTNRIKAILTTQWSKTGYRPLTVTRVENYYVENSMDNDADTWQLQIGDPDGDLLEVLERNNEVRAKIFSVGTPSLPVLTGFADSISYTTDGILTFSGRDMTSLAMDSTAPPQTFRQQRAWAIVQKEARQLGFTDTKLAKSGPEGNMVRKLLQRDGSETYWEFWYRLYRREKLWLWVEPNGELVGDVLNYSDSPLYYFGEPRKKDPRSLYNYYIPVERAEVTKSTTSRVGQIWVYGQRGNAPIQPAYVADPTMAHWLKRPLKIMLDTEIKTHRQAITTAWEEIFEGKVGSLEIAVTIADPGFQIRTNEIAVLNLPESGIVGTFYVVGVRRAVGPDGFLQEVRLRERQYATTRRVPADPVIRQTQGTNSDYATTELGTALTVSVPNAPQAWMSYFIKGANQWHGPWDYNLFLATLLGICDVETGFQNERSNGWAGGSHIIWYPWKPVGTTVGGVPKPGGRQVDQFGRTQEEWRAAFANENWDGQQDIAVGPMQLLFRGFKQEADNMMKSGYHNQYDGGRWVPEYNIMTAAHALRQSLQSVARDSGRDVDIWLGVAAYNQGPKNYTNSAGQKYAAAVRSKVMSNPGYLSSVQQSRVTSAQTQKDKQDDPVFPNVGSTAAGGPGIENSAAALRQLTNLQWGSNVDVRHTNFTLLLKADSLATALGRKIQITSGYRPAGMPSDGPGMAGVYGGAPGGDTQWYLWNVYKQSGFSKTHIAANPLTGSNHTRGQAIDATVGGVPIKLAVSSSLLAQYGLHGTVAGDNPHITLLSVSG